MRPNANHAEACSPDSPTGASEVFSRLAALETARRRPAPSGASEPARQTAHAPCARKAGALKSVEQLPDHVPSVPSLLAAAPAPQTPHWCPSPAVSEELIRASTCTP
jgi:hypothetical protein